MELPVSLVVNGVKYVREDVVQREEYEPPVAWNMSYTVSQLESLTGVNRQSIYRAVRLGQLSAVYPNGSARGMRVFGSDYLDWIAGSRSWSSRTEQSS